MNNIKKLGYVLLAACLLVIIFAFLKYDPPIFSLNEKNASYAIRKSGNQYWIELTKENYSYPDVPFHGDAIRISGSDVNLELYVDKPIKPYGYFTTRTGEHSYYITDIDLLPNLEKTTN